MAAFFGEALPPLSELAAARIRRRLAAAVRSPRPALPTWFRGLVGVAASLFLLETLAAAAVSLWPDLQQQLWRAVAAHLPSSAWQALDAQHPVPAPPSPPAPPVPMTEPPVAASAPAPAIHNPGGSAPSKLARRVVPLAPTQGASLGSLANARPSASAAEVALYSRALSQLNQEHDPAAALATLNAYGFKYPGGILRGEAMIAQIKAELMLGLDVEVLGLLDAMEEEGFRGVPQVAEARLLRAELLVQKGRCQDAAKALKPYLEPAAPLEQRERALYARASCRVRLGEFGAAREEFRAYLDAFPTGRFAAQALETLAGLPYSPTGETGKPVAP